MPMSSLSFHASTIEIFVTYFKWREAPKIFHFFTKNWAKYSLRWREGPKIVHFLHKIGQNKASEGAKRRKFSIFYTKLDKVKPQMARSAKNFPFLHKIGQNEASDGAKRRKFFNI